MPKINIPKIIFAYLLSVGLRKVWDLVFIPKDIPNGLGLVGNSLKNIESGYKYNTYFKKANGTELLISPSTNYEQTVQNMIKLIKTTKKQTAEVSELLLTDNPTETLRKVFNFANRHIRYKQDEKGKEQLRTPERTWHDRANGVDCDCSSIFIGSLLENLEIPYKIRVADYTHNGFSHVYIVAIPQKNIEVPMDIVIEIFGVEQPYKLKKDYEVQK